MKDEKKNSNKAQWGMNILLALGVLVGWRYISPLFNNDIVLGISLGIFATFVLIFIFFPEARKNFANIDFSKGNDWTYFTHPTNRPMMLGLLWFIVFSVINFLFPRLLNYGKEPGLFLVFSFTLFLMLLGYTGYLMLRKKEGIGKFGQRYYGFFVYLNGILLITLG
ncbi:MAG: hypothetical protein GY755_12370 [Chloroflexi bacterium]|nr:hypothetical protein [Chloroflexota bacterium]